MKVAPLTVTPHAIARFRQRTGCKKSDDKIIRTLVRMANNGTPMELKPEYRVLALIDHKLEDAEYIRSNQYILVIVANQIRTIHTGSADRWRIKR